MRFIHTLGYSALLPAVLWANHATSLGEATRTSGIYLDVPPCVVAAEWVRSNADRLPSSVAEFSSYSMPFRKAIYALLPIGVQERLWVEHLTGFLERSSEFSAPQRAEIKRALSILPQIFDKGSSLSLRRQIAVAFYDQTSKTFSREQRRALFLRLGSEVAPWAVGRTYEGSNILSLAALNGRSAAATTFGACECALDWSGECGSLQCVPTGNPHCDLTEQGCGPFAQIACDGDCGV
jgi:hypothetical protein